MGDRTPGFDDAELRAAAAHVRDEWRNEEETLARDAFVVWRHRRTLPDVLREHMARGDRIELRVHGHTFTGVVVALGADVISLRDERRPRVDVRFGAAVPIEVTLLARAVDGGRSGPYPDGGFRGRLLAREADGQPCRVELVDRPDPVVATVAPGDGVVFLAALDGTTSTVTLDAVVAVSSASSHD